MVRQGPCRCPAARLHVALLDLSLPVSVLLILALVVASVLMPAEVQLLARLVELYASLAAEVLAKEARCSCSEAQAAASVAAAFPCAAVAVLRAAADP